MIKVGPANYGKTFTTRTILNHFFNPANDKYSWIGVN